VTGNRSVLLRATVAPVLVFLVFAGALVAPDRPPERGPRPAVQGAAIDQTVWKGSYSRRFPGCVATVLWPRREVPTALVVRRPSGDVDRVAVDRKHAGPRRATGEGRTIGACRPPG
jgi:hypothetical protein